MTQQEKEKMFLDLNSVLVKFWIEQGRPDKEVKIELLERMLNWYKKMGTITLDKQSKEPVSEDLEEAAENYAEKHGFRVPYDGSEKFYDETDVKASKDGFIAGAEWQAERFLKGSPMPEDTVIFQKGIEEGKRLMMEEAVEGMVCKDHIVTEKPFYFYQSRLIELPDNLKEGDKVKIVIVKEN